MGNELWSSIGLYHLRNSSSYEHDMAGIDLSCLLSRHCCVAWDEDNLMGQVINETCDVVMSTLSGRE
eukprot:475773-Rhodomonas_salina.1